ncbi:MAG: sugar phosphorylase [Aestuariivita sp.]|nr:sugar phosphorylase [Aestuariivita sp.]MCY4201468.1 sugar phosphorylase [Aestuariivita sp.]
MIIGANYEGAGTEMNAGLAKDEAVSPLRRLLREAYDDETVEALVPRILALVESARSDFSDHEDGWIDETDVFLITYGDSITDEMRPPLGVLNDFLSQHLLGLIRNVHVLPCFPWTSDDGFSVLDYREIKPGLGDWSHIQSLSRSFGVMLDAVINHISSESGWFKGFRNGDPKFREYFHICDPMLDYSGVTRPRALPLLTRFATESGPQYVWTTFSEDQVDLNYANPDVLVEILDVLLFYARRGARFIRLDAVGFLWKKLGTTCMHLPETHAIIQVMRWVLDAAVPGVLLITETNVPHADNISYFGDGDNESHMVYQFPLPPLTLQAFQTGDARLLSQWAATLAPPSPQTTYFNFLASHDGIGVRPAEGILTRDQVEEMATRVEANGGRVSMRGLPDGSTAPYELNISFLDAISLPDDDDELSAKKFLAAQAVLLSLVGVPAIYIHSLLGIRNDYQGLAETGRNRSINRKKLKLNDLLAELRRDESLSALVFAGHCQLLSVRRTRPAFHPDSAQRVLFLDDRVFSLVRDGKDDWIWATINVSEKPVSMRVLCAELGRTDTVLLRDIISGQEVRSTRGVIEFELKPYSAVWFAELEAN